MVGVVAGGITIGGVIGVVGLVTGTPTTLGRVPTGIGFVDGVDDPRFPEPPLPDRLDPLVSPEVGPDPAELVGVRCVGAACFEPPDLFPAPGLV